jgi:GT2 family glycosyltransferase
MANARLSVIVPVGPNDDPPVEMLAILPDRSDIERLVSATTPRPNGLPDSVEWLAGEAGRGRQLNRAARAATGRWLWFLHADSRLEPDAWPQVDRFLEADHAAIGYCRLRFLDDGPKAVALNALGANWRSRLLGRPYGDQGLCLTRETFWRLGGFREDLDRGEDLDFVVRARAAGVGTRCMGPTIRTSARRYREQGWLATTLAHHRAARRLIRDARNQSQGAPE